jgi:hypothetical protein
VVSTRFRCTDQLASISSVSLRSIKRAEGTWDAQRLFSVEGIMNEDGRVCEGETNLVLALLVLHRNCDSVGMRVSVTADSVVFTR